MTLNAEWTTFLIALLASLITVMPVAIGLVKTYLKVLENHLAIKQLPTESRVGELFHQKLAEAGLDGGNNDDTTGHTDPGPGSTSTN